jgi:hypothetical protein
MIVMYLLTQEDTAATLLDCILPVALLGRHRSDRRGNRSLR